MSIDWNAIAALGGWVAAVVAFSAYLLQRRQMSFSANLDSLWRLEDKFNDDAMVTKRAMVAKRLLDKDTTPDRDTEDILDYFDLIGYLIDRKALDKETAWMMFSDAAFGYWFGARTYIDANGTGEPYWGDFKSLINEVFVPIEGRKGKLSAEEVRRRALDHSAEFLACEIAMKPVSLTTRTLTSASSGRAGLGRPSGAQQPEPSGTVPSLPHEATESRTRES